MTRLAHLLFSLFLGPLMIMNSATGLQANPQDSLALNPIDTVRPDAPALAARGDLAIGVRTLKLINPAQIDIVNTTERETPIYDRPLTVEIWYPADETAAALSNKGTQYTTVLRDGKNTAVLSGRATRGAPPASGKRYPLIVISHGYPGNRYLMSHLGENLATKGFVTVSIDHTDSTYSDQAAFGATLYHRPLDQRFVIDQMAKMTGSLGEIIDADNTGIIGYSMGGYGALVFGGAGVTQASTEFTWGTPNGLLARHLAGSDSHEALMDERVKSIIAIGPWGQNAGFWDTNSLAGLRKPLMLVAGSADDVSVYDAMRLIFDDTNGTDRHLLTFHNANHNAAAPMPAPKEVFGTQMSPFDHYADAVWDTTRMNNILQHFATAFMGKHLKNDADMALYLDLVKHGADGVVAEDETGKATLDHTYWHGFLPRTAVGLSFETKIKGE